jgi:hypothetical protein
VATALGHAGGLSSDEYVAANGRVIRIPRGWQYRGPTLNNLGGVWQRPGALGDADSIRIMEPGADSRYPNGYIRYYNRFGQPLDIYGKPGDQASTHIPLDYLGPIPGWPQ